MKRKILILCLSMAAACAQNSGSGLTVQVGGRTVGTRSTLNLNPGGGILESCVDNAANNRVDCTPGFNSAVVVTHDTVHGSESYCNSVTQTTSYTCRLRYKALPFYAEGTTFLLNVDTSCIAACSLNIDNLGVVNIKKIDGTSDPGGALVAGQPQWIFHDGTVFRLMGAGPGAGTGAAPGVADSRRDVIARRVIGSMETMPYASSITLDVTAGDVHKTLTAPAAGNATVNASTGGLAGQHMWIIIANDTVSAKTVTFGANFRSSGTLTGVTGKAATIQFVSDGTAWYETGRTLNL
jgi:hypothetical protein